MIEFIFGGTLFIVAFFWLGLAIIIGFWASKLGRDGIVWGLLAAFISPLITALFLAILGEDKSHKFAPIEKESHNNNDSEWEIVKKYVPEVKTSLEEVLHQLDNKGILLAEKKLKELFFVIGRDGLTTEALNTIVNEVSKELKDSEIAQEQQSQEINDKSLSIDMELVKSLKGGYRVGFNSDFSLCDICNIESTRQTLNNHFVCSKCKQNYL